MHLVSYTSKVFKRHKDLGLRYFSDADPTKRNVLSGFVDSDWAADVNDRKSQTGYVFFLNGAPISWTSSKQTTPALSTAEAEYMALAAATQEALYLRQLLECLGYPQSQATVIGEVNQGCIALAESTAFSKRTRHIDIRYHFIRQHIEDGAIRIEYVPTVDQLADALTKALPRIKHGEFTSGTMAVTVNQPPTRLPITVLGKRKRSGNAIG